MCVPVLLQPVVPPRFCDDRVQVLQADARLLTPAILERYTTDVSGAPAAAAEPSNRHTRTAECAQQQMRL